MGFRVRAVNTASDSENKIHDDRIAAEYGFRGALVPGVTVYGYLAAAVVEHYGPEWLQHGAMDVRFFSPVYENDEVEVSITPEVDRIGVEAAKCAIGTAWIGQFKSNYQDGQPAEAPQMKVGTHLKPLLRRPVETEAKMSAPLAFSIGGKAHPAALLALANRVFVENFELGPWIHVSSEVRKFRACGVDEAVDVRAQIVDAYEKKGHEFVVLDVMIENGSPIEQVRHTAIWKPRVSR